MPPIRHAPASPQMKIRQRSRRACAPCRKRKIKCDGDEPCAACVGYGYDCIFAETWSPPKPQGTGKKSTNASTPSSDVGPSATGAVLQKQDGPYMATESVLPDANSALLNQTFKTKFTSSSSAIAFPTNLGLSLGLSNPPRLQSFGWNPGLRAEQKFLPTKTICNIISLEEMRFFADRYFKEVQIYFNLTDKTTILARAADFWTSSPTQGTDLEALVCQIVALGSYFSGSSSLAAEAEIVEHGRILLDLSTAHPPALLSCKHVAAWVLRAIYLRCTTRPNLSWMASCTALHLAESIGLHREVKNINFTRQEVPRQRTELEIDLRRRNFWVASALNQFLSAETGRTKVHIDSVDCTPLQPHPGDLTAQTVTILQTVPGRTIVDGTFLDLSTALDTATTLPANSPFLVLLKADVSFVIFRVFRSTNVAPSLAQVSSLLEIIRVALDAVKFLRTMNQPWWNVVCTPFHSICVLLSLNTSESLAMIPGALETLKSTVAIFDSFLPNEALRTTYTLVQAARSKMGRDMESLDLGLSIVGELSGQPEANLPWGVKDNLGYFEYFDFGNMVGIDDAGLLDSEPYLGF
ncbi:Protein RDR1 [Lachnellula suecica]|uniref:Protein RDR1 n=1 Tax=Lachnellula suecica TaxID=602035 RepID=A0A8T9C895_9HELO|nr:Protein RDR1 [Lachnellula suecica]